MKCIVQRVAKARISYDGEAYDIGKGIVVLCGFCIDDTEAGIQHMCRRLFKLRIFEDDCKRLNIGMSEAGADIMFVPNFTVYADTAKNNRPSFSGAAPFDVSKPMFDFAERYIKDNYSYGKTVFGRFGADMLVEIANDGPVTLIMEE